MNQSYVFISLLLCLICGCKPASNEPLPILGPDVIVDGNTQKHAISDFSFLAQDSSRITNKTLSKGIYVADFFFTSCPSICPKVTKNMLKIHDFFKTDDRLTLVSFTLDPKRDTPAKLKLYGDNLGIDHQKWKFLHGSKDATYDLAKDYMVSAVLDEEAPGGINHSGTIVLVDKKGHIRSYADGTDSEAVDELIEHIIILLLTE